MLLSAATMTGCVTGRAEQPVLPPKPVREAMPEVSGMRDVAAVINYYEHLVRKWEQWGSDVEEIVLTCP